MEIWDLYDANRNIIGEHTRGEELPKGAYHLVVHVWIKNENGHYLVSQRSETRPTFPLMWECVGGSVLKGENSLQGALRETKEEVGVDLSVENGKLLFSNMRNDDIVDVWLFEYNGDISLDNATTDEVRQVKWMSRNEIQKLKEDNTFVSTLYYFFDKVD